MPKQTKFVDDFKNALKDDEIKDLIYELFVRPVVQAYENSIEELRQKVASLENANDNLEQQGRKDSIRIKNVPEEELEEKSTDDFVIDFAKEHLDLDLTPHDISVSHKLSKEPNDHGKFNLIVKFSRRNVKRDVYSRKKKLKNSGYVITEDLTFKRRAIMARLGNLRWKKKIFSCWSMDGKIFYKAANDKAKGKYIDTDKIKVFWDSDKKDYTFVTSDITLDFLKHVPS